MPSISWLEAFGYAASVVVAISLMMGSLLKLRWWNLVGASAFALYGLLIKAYPVAVLNGFIALADVYYLIQMYRRREHFQAISLDEASSYLATVLAAHREEIARIFPGENWDEAFRSPLTEPGVSVSEGELLLAREGGHSVARVVHAGGAATGAEWTVVIAMS